MSKVLTLKQLALPYVINFYLNYLSESNRLISDLAEYGDLNLKLYKNSNIVHYKELFEKIMREDSETGIYVYHTKKNTTYFSCNPSSLTPAAVLNMIQGSEYVVIFCSVTSRW